MDLNVELLTEPAAVAALQASSKTRQKTADLRAEARKVGLRYRPVSSLDIERRAAESTGQNYVRPDGSLIKDQATLERIMDLAIPPAWTEVRIASVANSHIQAVGRDEKGRVQYLYHPDWELLRERRKSERLMAFAAAIGRIRKAVAKDLARKTGDERLALAAGVALIDETAIRVGSEIHLRRTGARGAVTLLPSNARVQGQTVYLKFRAKGGKPFETAVEAPRLARALVRLKALKAKRLLSWRRDDGTLAHVSAHDLNAYLKEISGEPISAKDFRTFHATAIALDRLSGMEPDPSDRKRNSQIVAVTREVSERLGNTPAVVRKSYVLVTVLERFADGNLAAAAVTGGRMRAHMKPHETALARFFAQDSKASRKRSRGTPSGGKRVKTAGRPASPAP